MDKKCLKIAELAALLALCAALCVGTWAQGRQEALSGKLLRLHVLAHSDTAAEQRIKLRVRDAVLEYVEPLLEEAAGLSQAEGLIAAHMEEIAAAAFSACSRFQSRTARPFTPSSANRFAMAKPIPCAAPVTTATLPSKPFTVLSSSF